MQYPIYNLGITKRTTRLDVLRKRHYNYIEEWDKLIFTFICEFIKKFGFFEWSEWSFYSQQGMGDIFLIESLLPIAGAHIPLPKVVKAEELSSCCKYCRKPVCVSNCEQEIKDFNETLPSFKNISKLVGIPQSFFEGTTHG